ncbi:hypothetical protein NQ317_000272, partial [Molorchus minor]
MLATSQEIESCNFFQWADQVALPLKLMKMTEIMVVVEAAVEEEEEVVEEEVIVEGAVETGGEIIPVGKAKQQKQNLKMWHRITTKQEPKENVVYVERKVWGHYTDSLKWRTL